MDDATGGSGVPNRPPDELRALMDDVLKKQTAELGKKQTAVGGSMLGAIVLGLFYFGQSQLTRLDRLAEELSAMRTQMSVMQTRVDSNAAMRLEIEGLRSMVRDHEKLNGHAGVVVQVEALQERVKDLERAQVGRD